MDWFAGILIFLLVVGIWAAIGHGIWLVLAAIGKAIFGGSESQQAAYAHCHHCGAPRGVFRGRCIYCGAAETVALPPTPPGNTLTSEIQGALKQLDRLWRRGLLSDEEHHRLHAACQRDLDRLTRKTPAIEKAESPQQALDILYLDRPATEVKKAEPIEILDAEIVVEPSPAQPQAVHPLDRVDAPAAPAPTFAPSPPIPRRALADVLAAFMQERNIRWGELVSGLLIVGSAAGLVLSLRDELNKWIPYFPAFLFLLATAALHGAGLYTLRKWNLQSTSRGVLTIVLLLVPLNFLAAVLVANDTEQRVPMMSLAYVAAISIGILSFGAICWSGAQALVGKPWPPLAMGVLGISAIPLAINRTPPNAAASAWLIEGGLAAALFIGATLGALVISRRWKSLSLRRAQPLFLTMAVGGFALILTNAFLVHKAPRHWQTLVDLTPAGSLIGASIVLAGLFLFARTRGRRHAWLAATGTSLAIFGSVVMLGAVVFAWPHPLLLVAVGLLSCAALATLAFAERTPPLHVPAVACAALAVLVGFHLWQGNLPVEVDDDGQRILSTWLLGRSALVLTGVAIAVSLYGGWLAAKQQLDHAIYLLASAGGLMALSLGIAIRAGFFDGGDAELATIVFAIYAVAVAIATAIYPHRGLTVTAAALLLMTMVHGLGFNSAVELWLAARDWLPERPVLLATLGHALSITAIAVALALRRKEVWQAEIIEPLASFACAATLCAGWWAVVVREEAFAVHAGYVAAIAIVWLCAAALYRLPELFAAGQAVAMLAVIYAALAVAKQQAWWHEFALDPRTIALVLCVLAVWIILWMLARRWGKGWLALAKLIDPPWPAVDEVLLGALVAVGLAGSLSGVGLGVVEELHLSQDALSTAQVAWLSTFKHPLLWAALACGAVAVALSVWQQRRLLALVAIGLLGLIAANLASVHFVESIAVASAFRWSLAAWVVAMTAAAVAARQLKLPEHTDESWTGLCIVAGALPIVVLTVIACSCAAQQIAPRGPLPETFFQQIGWTISYATPLLAVVSAFIAFGLHYRQAAFMPAGSLVWQLLVSLGVVMPVLTSGGAFDLPLAVALLQWNIIGGAGFSLVWLGLRRWLNEPRYEGPPLLAAQVTLVATALLGLAGWCAAWVIGVGPLALTIEWLPFGMGSSFLALGLSAVAGFFYCYRNHKRDLPVLYLPLGLVAVTFTAAALQPLDTAHPWLSYHALLAGWLGCAAAATFAMSLWPRTIVTAALAGGALAAVALLELFSGWGDPIHAWPTGINLGLVIAAAALGLLRRRQPYAYASVLLTILAASQWFAHYWPAVRTRPFDVIAVNLFAVVLTCGWWLAVEIFRERRTANVPSTWKIPPVPNVVTPVLVAIAVLFIGLCYAMGRTGFYWTQEPLATSPANLFAIGALGAYLAAMLWYDRQHLALPGLFVWGGLAALMTTERLPLPEHMRLVVALTAQAIYLAIVGLVWQSGARLANAGRQLGIHEPIVGLERTARWLPVVTILAAAAIALFDVGFVLSSQDRLVRMLAGFGPALLALSLAMQAQLERRTTFIYLSLLSGTFAAVLLSWADLPPGGSEDLWLQRLVRLLVVLGALAVLYAAVLPRVWNQLADWLASLWRMALTCGAGAGVALVLILAIEALQFASEDISPLSHAEVAVVAVVLTVLGSLLVAIAVLPATAERRAIVATDAGRMGCVYAAQAVFTLTFAHLYLARHEWFDGLLKPYWPFIAMAIAFAGVGISEFFARRRVRVLSEPFGRTGVMLPLLPAIGWWIEAARGTPTTDYALVMFVVGLLYVLVAMTRRSLASAVAASVSGNIALWSLMHDRGFDFVEHPQFWLIPPALSALAGAQLNQTRLTKEQLAAVRYVSMLVIYLSSTSEIFITGVDTLWPPLVLASLSVIGVLAGMALHIRPFIYLGASFVFLSMVTMVWHASRRFEQVWPWWAFGICVGLAMLVFFGMFEKRRGKLAALGFSEAPPKD